MKYLVCSAVMAVLCSGLMAVAEPPAERAAEPKAQSPAEKLKACEAMYAAAKTYQDVGEVKTEFTIGDEPVTSTALFSTAFERDGRFRWQLDYSTKPGDGPNHRYTIWSADQKTYQSSWTFNGNHNSYDAIELAMAGPAAISGGAATAVVAQLRPSARWTSRVTDLREPVEKPAETIEKTACSVITGQDRTGDAVTLWLDSSMAIRRIRSIHQVDPTKIPGATPGPRFNVTTTISITPVIDGKIADERFAPPTAE